MSAKGAPTHAYTPGLLLCCLRDHSAAAWLPVFAPCKPLFCCPKDGEDDPTPGGDVCQDGAWCTGRRENP